MTTPYEMLKAARDSACDSIRHRMTHAVVRAHDRARPDNGWELGGLCGDRVSASALADSLAALYPPTTAEFDPRLPECFQHRTPGPWVVAELRTTPMGGEHAVPVHTGTARELVSPRELDAINDLMADCRTVLSELIDGAAPATLDGQMRDLIDHIDDLLPADEAERTVSMDRAERRAFTPHEPECLPD